MAPPYFKTNQIPRRHILIEYFYLFQPSVALARINICETFIMISQADIRNPLCCLLDCVKFYSIKNIIIMIRFLYLTQHITSFASTCFYKISYSFLFILKIGCTIFIFYIRFCMFLFIKNILRLFFILIFIF